MTAQTLSMLTLWSATLLYAIAMIAYAVHMSRVAEATGAMRTRERAAVGATAATAGSLAVPIDDPTADTATPAGPSKAYGIARASTLVGAAFHATGVVARGIEAGHVPWSTMYEYTITGSMVAVVVFLLVQRSRDISYLGAGVAGLATVALGLALTVLYAAATGLQPALDSFWLVIHVSIAIIATGVFAVAFVATSLQLLRDHRDAGASALQGSRWRFLDGVPTPTILEALAFRFNAVGFVLWTFTVMAGAIWAEYAWGRYWGWDAKEVWSFVIWVIFAAYLHARTTQGWAGRRSAYLACAGFVALIMNFTVVNFVFQGLHSYAGA